MSRALGDFTYKNNPALKPSEQIITAIPDITKTARIEVSHIIMGCDGIW
jgi:serine/threonine protein phosphatase PrpC